MVVMVLGAQFPTRPHCHASAEREQLVLSAGTGRVANRAVKYTQEETLLLPQVSGWCRSRGLLGKEKGGAGFLQSR